MQPAGKAGGEIAPVIVVASSNESTASLTALCFATVQLDKLEH